MQYSTRAGYGGNTIKRLSYIIIITCVDIASGVCYCSEQTISLFVYNVYVHVMLAVFNVTVKTMFVITMNIRQHLSVT